MKLLTAAQTRALDQATLQVQDISSVELMERAATACTDWLLDHLRPAFSTEIHVFCGPGNNGGDGLAMARQLHGIGYAPHVWLLPAEKHSADFTHNRQQLPEAVRCTELSPSNLNLPLLPPGAVVLDALFGTGLSRPLQGLPATVVRHLNQSAATVVAVDMPSGLLADTPQPTDSAVVQANYTLSFELPKLAFLLPRNAGFVGEWSVLPIGLDTGFIHKKSVENYFVDAGFLQGRLPKRGRFAHKGTFGHALLLAGSYGKLGAALLAAQACLRGGVGLLTVRTPGVGYAVLQAAVPEAMALPDPASDFVTELPELLPYAAVGMGPGLGQEESTAEVLRLLLQQVGSRRALVLDADALNLLATHRELLGKLPPNTILTPHLKEFERLTGEPARDDYHRLQQLRDFCQQHRCYCVLKGAYSALGTPGGAIYFNSTGNPGMATGGSGDVLTGLLLALRADQRLSPLDAALLGIYAHGRAGDLGAAETGEPGLIASDIVRFIGPALRELESYR